MSAQPLRGRGATNGKPSLTPRESEVLAHVANGLSREEIGRRLSISPETVRTHGNRGRGGTSRVTGNIRFLDRS